MTAFTLDPLQFVLTIFVVLVALLVWSIQQRRELANRLAGKFCSQHGIQLLDGTVAFQGIHLSRPGFQPVYRFAFSYSLTGADRFNGSISLIGRSVQHIHILPEHIES